MTRLTDKEMVAHAAKIRHSAAPDVPLNEVDISLGWICAMREAVESGRISEEDRVEISSRAARLTARFCAVRVTEEN